MSVALNYLKYVSSWKLVNHDEKKKKKKLNWDCLFSLKVIEFN